VKRAVPYSKTLNRAVLEIVSNQLRDGHPPQTRQAFDRLKESGLPEAEVRRLIACVVLDELYDMMKYGRPFDVARYAANLARLPEMPEEWDTSPRPPGTSGAG
jgi:hypothetical protein